MKQLIEMQTNDEGLWFVATHATEAYLQNALRQLHDAGEKLTAEHDSTQRDRLPDSLRSTRSTAMTDRELLESAAKAAGVEGYWNKGLSAMFRHGCDPWNPLTDDGDALRLAVKLRLEIIYMLGGLEVGVSQNNETLGALQSTAIDPYAATRRAIVRAASEIGAQP